MDVVVPPGAIRRHEELYVGGRFVLGQTFGNETHVLVFQTLSCPRIEIKRWPINEPLDEKRQGRQKAGKRSYNTTIRQNLPSGRSAVDICWLVAASQLVGRKWLLCLDFSVFPWCQVEPDFIWSLSTYQRLVRSRELPADPCSGYADQIARLLPEDNPARKLAGFIKPRAV